MIRFLIILALFLFLSSCQKGGSTSPSPRERIVTFQTDQNIIGRGVEFEKGHYMTASHVLSVCENTGRCVISRDGLGIQTKNMIRELREEVTVLSSSSDILKPVFMVTVKIGDRVNAFVSRSGAWTRIQGSIIAVDESYIGYQKENLSGGVYSGALVTDIIFTPSESGTPIWTASGELIGVVSAVDSEKRRSYIVR